MTDSNPLEGNCRYIKIKGIDSGSFGFVQLARDQLKEEDVAIKFIPLGSNISKYVETEVINHTRLHHPHIIELKDVFMTSKHLCIVMEYASGGSLLKYVQSAGQVPETSARWFFQQLLIALDYSHAVGIVNRDIKLENTLLHVLPGLPLPLVKVCDFGYSKSHAMSAPKSMVGTLAYMAPEVVFSTSKYDGQAADIWSCGVMLYLMLFGRYPFGNPKATHQAVQAMMEKITSCPLNFPPSISASDHCRDLLSRMLCPVPAQRITIPDIKSHPWFRINLPPNALAMNDTCLRRAAQGNPKLDMGRIRAVLAEACAQASSDVATADISLYDDDSYDDAANNVVV